MLYPFQQELDFVDASVASLPRTSVKVFVNLQKSGAGKTESVASAACFRYITMLDMTTDGDSFHSGAVSGLYADVKELAGRLPVGKELDTAVERYLEVFASAGLLLMSVFHHTLGEQLGDRRYEAFYRILDHCPKLLDFSYALVKAFEPGLLRQVVSDQVYLLRKVGCFCHFLHAEVVVSALQVGEDPMLAWDEVETLNQPFSPGGVVFSDRETSNKLKPVYHRWAKVVVGLTKRLQLPQGGSRELAETFTILTLLFRLSHAEHCAIHVSLG